MKFCYGEEKRKFEEEWERTAAWYAEQGMPTSDIETMREYDWNIFKAQRNWALHTQEVPMTDDADEESGIAESPMIKRYFERFTTKYDTYGSHSRFWWIEEIHDPRIARVFCKLSDLDKTLLTMIWIEGYTQAECAAILHMTRGAISMKIHRIFSKIAKIHQISK